MIHIISPKKLIEVSIPLDAINDEAAREKSIRHGHPSTLHLWWARRPLAAVRAVIFAQLVNDPNSVWEAQNPGQTPSLQQRGGFTQRRNHLFKLITDLVKWENTTNEELLKRARKEIRDSWREICALNASHPEAERLFNPEKMPGLHDPFAGGGSIPLEAQRLGLDAFASDLNPVAVLINKAMIEIPPKFAGKPPVHPNAERRLSWNGAQGLAEDVRRYGAWMREEVEKRIGHLYPKVKITKEIAESRLDLAPLVGQELTVIAWLWARTVRSPNPAFSHVQVPLVSTFVLSTKMGKQFWVEPIITGDGYRFMVRAGPPPDLAYEGTTAGKRATFLCLMSGVPIDYEHIRGEGQAGRMGQRLLAVVAEGPKGRIYLDPPSESESIAVSIRPTWRPGVFLPDNPRDFKTPNYGLTTFGDLFTPRQLVALTTFSDLVGEAVQRIHKDALSLGLLDEDSGLEAGGIGALSYAQAVSVYLGFVLDKEAEALSTLCTWSNHAKNELVVSTFRRQALPMTWDFGESNPFAGSSGDLTKNVDTVARTIETSLSGAAPGLADQASAQTVLLKDRFVSTDPPYYDNIGYADLSDYFYVWMRRTSRGVWPALFASIAVPKDEELIATPYRHASKEEAERFFLEGMTRAMQRIAEQAHPAGPVTIYYAFKQSETEKNIGTSSSGWETFLAAVLKAGFSITGTWPMRTERGARSVSLGNNALASSIILVCRRRAPDAPSISRREFLRELNTVLPDAIEEMIHGAGADQAPVAPVDLSQAIIGPGMAVFSKYSSVLLTDGSAMTVKTALQLINRFLAEDDFDRDTQFCLNWCDLYGWNEGPFGEADVLARAKSTSVAGLHAAGVITGTGGKVRLLRWTDYPADWDPRSDKRLPDWEALHHLVRAFRRDGESGAGQILGAVKRKTDEMRQLAYRLYVLCERRGWADDARAYNELITSWTAIEAVSNTVPELSVQVPLFGDRS